MIPTLNYPQPLPDAIVLDLTKRFTGSPGNALVRLNPKIAQTFSLSDLIDLQDWYYNGEGEQEDFVKFELLPQLVTAVLGKDDITEEGKFLNEYLIIFSMSVVVTLITSLIGYNIPLKSYSLLYWLVYISRSRNF